MNTDNRLFPIDALPAVSDPSVRLSYTRRLTNRRRELLERGVHPATRLPLLTAGRKRTCWSCDNLTDNGRNKRTYYKCVVAGITNGPATDIRLSWPACTAYRPAGTPDPQQKLPPEPELRPRPVVATPTKSGYL